MSDAVIDIQNVEKTYRGKVHALRGVAMQVQRGQVFGLLGPNGAGKSTLVKILMTVVRPSACRGTLLGEPIGQKAALARVGYLPEHHRFPEYLTAWQVLDYFGALAGVPRRERRKRGEHLLEMVGMSQWRGKAVKTFSKGMRQRLGIANALVNDPELVLLDEPTDGVDPVGRRDIRNMLSRLREEGRTVLLNSHLLSELEMVCDRVAILVQGQVKSHGTIDELTAESRRYEVEVGAGPGGRVEEGAAERARAALDGVLRTNGDAAGTLGTLAGDVQVDMTGATIRVLSEDPRHVQPVIDVLRAAGVTIRAVRPVRPSLEDLFMRAVTDPATGKELLPGAASGKGR
jgi:ABC-2 type transport system ATP-binding protein